jgi:subtilisin family serine protease
MIWKKRNFLRKKRFHKDHQTSSLQKSVHNGPLPNPIPSNWAYWEPEVSVKPLFPSIIKSPGAIFDTKEDPWWPKYLKVKEAWDLVQEKRPGLQLAQVKFGLIDSGSTFQHPWLRFFNASLDVPGNGLDDDDNGFVDDLLGYDFVFEKSTPQDQFGHGTHVSGILAGQDPLGKRPLAPASINMELVIIRALNRYGLSNSIDLARALEYAADSGVEVINCSWGGGSDTQVLRDAFEYLVSRNVIIFSSAGNDKLNTDQPGNAEVPKTYPGVIGVAAHTEKSDLAKYSNYGPKRVDFMAPGDKIWSTTMDGGFGTMSGTSMASPMAASIFTYLYGVGKTLYPSLNTNTLKAKILNLMCATAKPVLNRVRCGILDLYKATSKLLEEGL